MYLSYRINRPRRFIFNKLTNQTQIIHGFYVKKP